MNEPAPPNLVDLLRDLPDLGDPYAPERVAVVALLAATPAADLRAAARARALRYIAAVRASDAAWLSAQNLLASFPLASREGVALLRLAEALLRAPDAETQTWLIAEKLAAFRESSGEAGAGQASFVQRVLSTALRLAGQVAGEIDPAAAGDATSLRNWLAKSALRPLVIDGIRRFGDQFVFATNLETALARAAQRPDPRELYSYDMLGEGARTAADARRNGDAYARALAALRSIRSDAPWHARDGISVKLSAIHPRFETMQLDRVLAELYPTLLELARTACEADVNFTIDAEESERLVLQIALTERLMREPSLADWPGLGLAVQAYQPRVHAVIDHLLGRAREWRRPLAIRLVKGAYWDAEIKRAQELGLSGFPVLTRKWATDLSYVAAALKLLATDAPIYPQFATHNALTVATLLEASQRHPQRRFEFQRLHGMGVPLYASVLAEHPDTRVRVYAPVGRFHDLLAYLVRRLLENGANSSFVHQISDDATPPESLVADPFDTAQRALALEERLPALPTGAQLFGERHNSRGIDLQHAPTLIALTRSLQAVPATPRRAASLIAGVEAAGGEAIEVRNPAALDQVLGRVVEASRGDAERAIAAAQRSFVAWDALAVADRADKLRACADRFEAADDELMALLVREAGKTMLDAHLEVREAVDFLRYYAALAEQQLGEQALPGPAGESNRLRLAGRGVFVCISPWNFPLAIFTGQIAAALVTGNTVIAKPAEQTPLIAHAAVRLMHAAGIPNDVLHLMLGRGETVGAALTSDSRIAGVAFTGSTATARAINRALAQRDAPIGVLIAETGGQNAMLVDSTALLEQVTDAVISSAFRSCGQRCSALRVLFVQIEVADELTAMIAGAMRELRIGDPADPRIDVGPVIDAEQLAQLVRHRDWLRANATRIFEGEAPAGLNGHFFAPVAYEIDAIAQLAQENFGPILHVVRFDKQQLDATIDAINATGYGLTCGLHTRLDARVAQVAARMRAGNLYVNRNMIGAVVGVQPFGGEGLSGTGPKAGGPHYLLRFCTERTLTINTAAAGGNVELAAGLS
jgi:RHH-type proline utilization regulon transcriptional repressor/proline dehydrogenase/delta 1-pyrroline-5-carboxylate dehydrogenase